MLRPWPWGACWGSGLGPGVPAGEGVWRVWRVLEGLGVLEGVWRVWKVSEGLEGLEGFGRCFEGLEGLEGFGAFGVFAGWQTAALKANRKPLLWPWPWGACLRSGLGPGVPVGEGVWRVWRVFGGFGGFWMVWRVLEGVWRVWTVLEGLEGFGAFGVFAGWQTAALKANRKPLLWPWPWGACWGRCLEGLESFGGFGRFWKVWSVCRRANGSFESP